MQQVMLQTVSSVFVAAEFHNEPQSQPKTPEALQYFIELKSEEKRSNDSRTITPFDHNQKPNCKLSGQSREQEAEDGWPEIESIVAKIRALELKLKEEHNLGKELSLKIVKLESRIAMSEEVLQQKEEELARNQQTQNQLDNRIKQLQNALCQKENLLAERQQLLSDIQFAQLRKNAESEEKIKKMNSESKDCMDRLRKANLELEKERRSYKELKVSMHEQIQQLQSQREEYLIAEMQKLKDIISNSKEQRELVLYQEIDVLSRKMYQQQDEIKRKNIELSLFERKKQQAINDIVEKKDGEMKAQKSLFKSLNDKMLKLQEQLKAVKLNLEAPRSSRHLNRFTNDREEEVSFELSPDRV